ncbi:MAG: hypothetical protein ABF709_07375 [Leuconostoc pseudomesenteroides]|uniref:hypothetical protein n=1 Tax=Leuconostoc pseudomesenteroides TaxID=33968 RepID=UPI001E51E086|nr:hypothetical protein [Leuconostoc pseudomesenteroides]MCC7669032.1 hypothetical protein [Leuconostoc pseudomesenteroides]
MWQKFMNWRETVTLRDSAWCMFGMAVPEILIDIQLACMLLVFSLVLALRARSADRKKQQGAKKQ